MSKNSLFWQLGPESAHPQNSYASRNGFLDKKTQGPVCCTTWRPRYWRYERCTRKMQKCTSWYIKWEPNTGGGGGKRVFVIFVVNFNFKFRPHFCTYESKNRAPFLKPTACIYIYIHIHIATYIYAVKLKTGPRYGGFKVKAGPSLKFKLVQFFSSLFSSHFIVFLGMFINTNSVTLCQNSVFAKNWGCQKWGFRKENCIICFVFLMLENRNRKKNKLNGKKPKTYKNSFFF